MNKKGTVMIYYAIFFSIFCGFSALVVDIGLVMSDKTKLSSAVDSASLAAVSELVVTNGNPNAVATSYFNNNYSGAHIESIDIDAENKTIQIKGLKTVKSYFAGLLGIYSSNVTSIAKAKIGNISALSGLRPLAVVQQQFVYGAKYTLKEGGGDGTTGNYGAIALGGNGAAIYYDNLLYGYDDVVKVGDLIDTEPGNIAGKTVSAVTQLVHSCSHIPECTYQHYNSKCERIIYIPVVNTLDVNGKKLILVMGFATFFLEGVTSNAGKADVIGRFIKYATEGEISNGINDYGTYGVKLIK